MMSENNISLIEKELTDSDILGITETYRYYLLLDKECKDKIPEKFKKFLEKYKDLDVGEPLHPEIPIEMQDISDEGWNLIAYMGTYIQ